MLAGFSFVSAPVGVTAVTAKIILPRQNTKSAVTAVTFIQKNSCI